MNPPELRQIAACERIGRLSACLVAECDWIGQWEGAILGVSAGISQILDALRAGRLRESLSLLAGIVKIGC